MKAAYLFSLECFESLEQKIVYIQHSIVLLGNRTYTNGDDVSARTDMAIVSLFGISRLSVSVYLCDLH